MRLRNLPRALALSWALAVASAASAAPPSPVTEVTLDNGLRVLVLEDHRNPIVTVQTWYRVGARNEVPGKTGLAHFLEHLMFKGTPTHGKGQFARVVEQGMDVAGGGLGLVEADGAGMEVKQAYVLIKRGRIGEHASNPKEAGNRRKVSARQRNRDSAQHRNPTCELFH